MLVSGSLLVVAATVTALLWSLVPPEGLDDRSSRMIAGVALAALAGCSIACARAVPRVEGVRSLWLHPPVLLALWLNIALVVPAAISFADGDILHGRDAIAGLELGYSAFGVLAVLLMATALWFGYAVGLRVGPAGTRLRALGRKRGSPAWALCVYAAVVAASVARIQTGGIAYGALPGELGEFGVFQQWVIYFQDIGILVLCLAAARAFRRQWPLYPLAVLACGQILLGLGSGFMKPVFWASVTVLLAALDAGLRPARLIPAAVLFGLVGVVAVSMAETIRLHVDSGAYDTRNLGAVVTTTQSAAADSWAAGAKANWDATVDRFLFRQGMIAHTPGAIIMKTPNVFPFLGLREFLAIPAYVVPRAIWVGKPVASAGNRFAIDYLNAAPQTSSSAAVTLFGEGYMIFGWTGVAMVGLLHGMILGALLRKLGSAGLGFLLLALLPTFVDFESPFTSMTVALVQRLVVFLLASTVLLTPALGDGRVRRQYEESQQGRGTAGG